jgi:hypothetical protein
MQHPQAPPSNFVIAGRANVGIRGLVPTTRTFLGGDPNQKDDASKISRYFNPHTGNT